MLESQQISQSPSSAALPRALDAAMRVDAAHVVEGKDVIAHDSADASAGAVSEPSTAVTLEQIRTQATQLASHLQRHQSSLDHRESELNARLAAMENQLRSARLWLGERHAE